MSTVEIERRLVQASLKDESVLVSSSELLDLIKDLNRTRLVAVNNAIKYEECCDTNEKLVQSIIDNKEVIDKMTKENELYKRELENMNNIKKSNMVMEKTIFLYKSLYNIKYDRISLEGA